MPETKEVGYGSNGGVSRRIGRVCSISITASAATTVGSGGGGTRAHTAAAPATADGSAYASVPSRSPSQAPTSTCFAGYAGSTSSCSPMGSGTEAGVTTKQAFWYACAACAGPSDGRNETPAKKGGSGAADISARQRVVSNGCV